MSTCGYVCPACDGKKVLESGAPCNWCIPDSELIEQKKEESLNKTQMESESIEEG